MTYTDADARSEAAVVADLADDAANVKPHELDPGQLYGLMVPDGKRFEVLDLTAQAEQTLGRPLRNKGTISLLTADSFVQTVQRYEGPTLEVFADPRALSFTAIFNGTAPRTALPGFGDHRAVFGLIRTDPWTRWNSRDGKVEGQVPFAEHIETSLEDIVDPAAADMLEIAQSFHAHSRVQFRSGARLQDGTTQLVYDEETEASAGARGQLEIPSVFYLALQPFEGAKTYRVMARLRYRIGNGNLQIGYVLDRPEDYERTAFEETLTDLEQRLETSILWGSPAR